MKTVAGQAHRWLSALVIVSALSGCDNVEWGGAEWSVVEPPPSGVSGSSDEPAGGRDEEAVELPAGPVLFAGFRDPEGVRVVPVAEISGDSLRAFPSDVDPARYRTALARNLMAPGTRFILFAGGTRVGTLIADRIVPDTTWCLERPAARGPVELVPEARDVTRFVALPAEVAGDVAHAPFADPPETQAVRSASNSLLARLIQQLGARWPGDLDEARADLEVFSSGERDAFAATFLMGDELGTGEAPGWAWSIFLLAARGEGGFEPDYVWYRLVSEGGKAAPRFVQTADWDRDGENEVLVEVFGQDVRWLAALGRAGSEMRPIYQDACAPESGFSGSDEPGAG